MTTRESRPKTLEAIEHYTLRKSDLYPTLSAADQQKLSGVVRQAVLPMAYMQCNSVYPFLKGMSELAHWAHARGYELKLSTLLSEELVWAFLAQRSDNALDYSTQLLRLAGVHGAVSSASASAARSPRSIYRTPYTTDEMTSLFDFSHSLSNENRRETLLTLIALGAGCGITRQRVRTVQANDVHFHNDELFVRAGHCAKVRDGFEQMLLEARAQHPDGLLVRSKVTSVSERAAGWTEGRRGVPTFSTDRLRATYVVTLMNDGASLRDLMAWTGLKGCEALEPYLLFVNVNEANCPLPKGVPSAS